MYDFNDAPTQDELLHRQQQADSDRFTITFFTDEFAKSVRRTDTTLWDLRDKILTTTAAKKEELPWLKLATFGANPTDKNNLRHDANVEKISGVELDYDGKQMSFETAVERLRKHKITALLYTTPSHTQAEPKWRVLCPTSVQLDPALRLQMAARINGIFNGIFAGESFTLSQSYYFGHTTGSSEHRAMYTIGAFIDQRADLDAGALGKDAAKAKAKSSDNATGDGSTSSGQQHAAADWTDLIAKIMAGQELHNSTRDMAAKLLVGGTSKPMALNLLRALMEQAALKDARWTERYADLPNLINSAETKFSPPPSIHATPFTWRDPATIPPRRWLYGRHYIRQFVSCTFSASGMGKTSLGIGELLAISSDRPLLGVAPSERGRVWYWNGEDPREEIDRRIAAAMLYHKLTAQDVEGYLFTDVGRETPICIATQTRDGAQIMEPVVDAVIEEIRRNNIDMMMIDPFVKSHRVTENDNNAIDRVMTQWAYIADVTNIAMELLHHTRKTGGAEVTVEDGRGASAQVSASRAARALNGMSKDEAERADIDPGTAKRYFRAGNGKESMAPPSDAATWFELVSVPLGNGDDVGVATTWKWPSAFAEVTVTDLRAVQTKIAAGVFRSSSQAKDWAGKVVAEVLGLDLTVPAARATVRTVLAGWIKNKMFREIERKDAVTRHKKMCIEVGQWATD